VRGIWRNRQGWKVWAFRFCDFMMGSFDFQKDFEGGYLMTIQQFGHESKNEIEEVIRILSQFYRKSVNSSLITEVTHLTRGRINRSYKIDGVAENFPIIFRIYNSAKTASDIKFEHRIMRYLKESKLFNYSGGVIPTDTGTTFVEEKVNSSSFFYSVFEYLAGDDRYTLTENNLTLKECQSFASVFANLHVAFSNFPDTLVLKKPRVNDQIPEMRTKLPQLHQGFSPLITNPLITDPRALKHNDFRQIWLSQETTFVEEFNHVAQATALQDCVPHLVIWKDGHGGNVKWTPNQEAVQHVFDFDWSQFDTRLFDLAFTLSALCSTWEKESNNGSLNFQKFRTVLEVYLSGLKDSKSTRINSLTHIEIDSLLIELRKINLYLLDWVHSDYHEKCKASIDFDPTYHVEYLEHVCKSILWIQSKSNQSQLNEIIQSVSNN